ncbi:hypothetical protein [Marinobacter sp.]|uniref:hypothetical protein n=1 Tax=Marinobacter sp. TaxID=50741 RepID=UPI0035682FE2
MKKITLILASLVLAMSATTALAMNGKADDINEARSYPNKTADSVADVRVSAK